MSKRTGYPWSKEEVLRMGLRVLDLRYQLGHIPTVKELESYLALPQRNAYRWRDALLKLFPEAA